MPPDTQAWCSNLLTETGYNWDDIIGLKKDNNGAPIHRAAYETLVNALRAHFDAKSQPVLLECDKPYERDDRYPVANFQEKIDELNNLNRQAGNLIITEDPDEHLDTNDNDTTEAALNPGGGL